MGLESGTYVNDLVSTNPLGTDLKSAGDDHIRLLKSVLQATFPGMAGRAGRAQTKAANYTAVVNDNTSIFDFSAAANLYLTAAATLGNGWGCAVYARGGDVTVDPNGTEKVNGANTSIIPTGYLGIIWCSNISGQEFFMAVMPGTEIKTTLDNKIAAGLHSIWMPAGAMTSQFTNGPSSGIIELATNDVMLNTLDFDTATKEYAQFEIRMPKSWNEGTVQFIPVWSHAATATNFGVAWGMSAKAVSNDDAMDAAFGTEVVVTDTGGTTDDLYEGAASAAVTINGTPAEGDTVQFRVSRVVADAGDTMTIDARLHGVVILYTLTANNDA